MDFMQKVSTQYRVEGEVLKWGRCLCGACGKKGKMGTATIPTQQKPVARILCRDCAVKEISVRHGVSTKGAEARHERTQKAQERLMKVILERYHEETGKRPPMKMDLLAPIVQPGLSWWNQGLSENERDRISLMSKDEQKEHFHNSPILPTPKIPITREALPGRNEPCPCGSGKKYKKCCLDKAA